MMFIDYLRAVEKTWGSMWEDRKTNMLTSSIMIKAYVRILGDLFTDNDLRDKWREEGGSEVFEWKISGWRAIRQGR